MRLGKTSKYSYANTQRSTSRRHCRHHHNHRHSTQTRGQCKHQKQNLGTEHHKQFLSDTTFLSFILEMCIALRQEAYSVQLKLKRIDRKSLSDTIYKLQDYRPKVSS